MQCASVTLTQHRLQYLDEVLGIVHTDLKPENILLEARDERVLRDIATATGQDANRGDVAREIERNTAIFNGQVERLPGETLDAALRRCFAVKITDFGAARWVTEKCPVMTVQTREYRCPEVILGVQHLTPKIDVWSLACITFELITGDFLFDPKRQKEIDMDVCMQPPPPCHPTNHPHAPRRPLDAVSDGVG